MIHCDIPARNDIFLKANVLCFFVISVRNMKIPIPIISLSVVKQWAYVLICITLIAKADEAFLSC